MRKRRRRRRRRIERMRLFMLYNFLPLSVSSSCERGG
jgi:hypothetical protein